MRLTPAASCDVQRDYIRQRQPGRDRGSPKVIRSNQKPTMNFAPKMPDEPKQRWVVYRRPESLLSPTLG